MAAGLAIAGTRTWADPPPNDDCINAIAIVEDDPPVPFSTVDATTDGSTLGCPDGNTKQDIWFRYQALTVKHVTVSLCDSDYDTHLAVYEGVSCPPTVLLDCNDDTQECFPVTRSEVVFISQAGAEYLIRVGGFGGNEGTGTLEVTAAIVPGINDECEFALEIGDGSTNFTTEDSTDSKPGLPKSCAAENDTLDFGSDIWFTYLATCNGTLTVNQCNIDYDGRMAVYRNNTCPPEDSELAACNDDACGLAEGPIALVFNVMCDELYTLRIGGWGGDYGSGTLIVTCDGSECADLCPWDLDDDGQVATSDLLALLGAWGTDPGGPPDFDGDGNVSTIDLLTLIGFWGECEK
jgi:hypothetical protein